MKIRFFIEIEYNGIYYHGWQIQKNAITIEKVLEEKLSILLKDKINVVGASRTDAKVHAKQMIAHFDTDKIPEKNFLKKINRFLPKYIKINKIYKVNQNIHARYNAINRTYKYIISTEKNPFEENLSWLISNKKINIKLMNKASDIILNMNYFDVFCKKQNNNTTTNCKLYKAYWKKHKKCFIFTITSNRFLRNMVRSIVGLLIDVGKKKISIKNFINIIKYNKKNKINSAPAHGLFLTKITYSTK